jgi:SAM-dependent methyltransferase
VRRPPVPDFELANRVGSLAGAEDPLASYEQYGRVLRDQIVDLVPADWSWEGRRVLDFGCGAGRILRHFLDEAARGEFYGCDIDGPSIEWLDRQLSPPLRVFKSEDAPPLPLEAAHFDLVYATSVFTHISDLWAAWLLELHRILKPDGLLIATFHGPGMYQAVTRQPEDEDRIGMNVFNQGRSWDLGGPAVLHSRWWIRAHWGRAFEIVELQADGFAAPPDTGHGVAVMRKRTTAPTVEELVALEPDEPREIEALRANIEQLHRENLRTHHWLEELQRSASWRVTAPLRRAKRWLRSP